MSSQLEATPPGAANTLRRAGDGELRRTVTWVAVNAILVFAVTVAALWPRRGTILLVVDRPLAGTVIKLDDRPIDFDELRYPLRLNVGRHQLVIEGDFVKALVKSFEVRPNKNEPVIVELEQFGELWVNLAVNKPAIAAAMAGDGQWHDPLVMAARWSMSTVEWQARTIVEIRHPDGTISFHRPSYLNKPRQSKVGTYTVFVHSPHFPPSSGTTMVLAGKAKEPGLTIPLFATRYQPVRHANLSLKTLSVASFASERNELVYGSGLQFSGVAIERGSFDKPWPANHVIDAAMPPTKFVTSLAAGDDLRRAVGASSGELWLLESDGLKALEKRHVGAVTHLRFSTRWLFSAGEDRRIRLWNFNSLKEVDNATLGVGERLIDLAPAGMPALIAGGHEVWVRDWLAPLIERFQVQDKPRFAGHVGEVLCAAFVKKSGEEMLTAGRDQLVILWNGTSGEEIQRFVGHRREVLHVAASDDGNHFASVDGGGQMILWKRGESRPRVIYEKRELPLLLAFPPGRDAFVAVYPAGEIKEWPIPK